MKKIKRIISSAAIAVFLLCLVANTWAITNTRPVADANYLEAEKAYNRTDYINASDFANMALRYYQDGGYADGEQNTLDLIGQIDDGLKKFGESFYNQALQYYNNQDWDNTITWAQKARDQYAAIESNSTDVQKCDLIISQSITRENEDNIKRADSVYDNALKLFDSGDYKNSMDMANQALTVYNQSNYQDGVLKCNALIQEIDRKINEIRATADVNDLKANEAYKSLNANRNFEDYKAVMTYAEQAKQLYAQIGYDEGYNHSVDMINGANQIIYGMEEAFKVQAANSFNDGRNDYLLGRGSPEEMTKRSYFQNATDAYNAARAIYQQLYTWADEIMDSDKKKAYQDLLDQCDARLAEVAQEVQYIDKGKKAEELYVDGYTFFTKGACENATQPVTDAKSLFNDVSDISGVFKCETLLDQINDCLDKLSQADELLQNVSRYYGIADYSNASSDLEKATAIYEEVKNQDGIDNCTALKQKISDSITAKKSADQLLAQAQADYISRKFDDSRKEAGSAQKIYSQINYLPGVGNATEVIQNNNDLEAKLSRDAQMNMLITVGAVVVAIVIVVIGTWMRRIQKAKKEKEKLDAEKRAMEAAVIHKQEEEKLQEEAKLKELEEERQKLKAMIAEEMKKIEVEKRGEP